MGFYCLNCRAEIRKGGYCGNTCRSAARRLRGRLASLHPSLARFHALLCEHVPIEASGYRLSLVTPEGTWLYPGRDRRGWRSVDDGVVYRSAFGLFPFEIPTVDKAGVFGVLLVQRGRVLDTPPALLAGVWLVPVLASPSPGQRLI